MFKETCIKDYEEIEECLGVVVESHLSTFNFKQVLGYIYKYKPYQPKRSLRLLLNNNLITQRVYNEAIVYLEQGGV